MWIKHLSIPIILLSVISCGGSQGTTNNQPDDRSSQPLAHSAKSLSPSSNCLNGGVTVNTGIDSNSNGELDPLEVTDTFDICLSAPVSNTSLPLITSVPSTLEECPNGGTQFNIGKDLNSDERLSENEVTSTTKICNGVDGIDGENGADGASASTPADRSNIFQVSTTYPYNNPDNPICGIATTKTLTKITEYETGDDLLENPIRQCTQAMCYARPENGAFSYSEHGGEDGCYSYYQNNYSCNQGFKFDPISFSCLRSASTNTNDQVCDLLNCSTQNTCLEVGGLWNGNQCNSICPIGEIRTSRGCELPISSCELKDSIIDNTCQQHTYSKIDPLTTDLCGYLSDDYHLESGEYLATCDVYFLGKTIIDAGVHIRFDGSWDMSFKSVLINGTEANPVIIGSGNSYLEDINIGGIYSKISDPTIGNPYSGAINNLIISGANKVHISNNNLSSSTINASDNITLENIESENNLYTTLDTSKYIYLNGSLSKSDTYAAYRFNVKDSILWDVTNDNIVLENSRSTSEYRQPLLFTKSFTSMLIDSSISDGECGYTGISPELIRSTISGSTRCSWVSLSTNSVFINNPNELTVSPSQPFEVSLLPFDADGPIVDNNEIIWKASYSRDGVTTSLDDEWIGNPATITLDKIESYYIYPVSKIKINSGYKVNVY